MGRVPSDEKFPDDMSAEGKCTVRTVYAVLVVFDRRDEYAISGNSLDNRIESECRAAPIAVGCGNLVLISRPPPVQDGHF